MIEMLHFLLSSTPTSRPLESSLHRWYRLHFHAIIFRSRSPACTRPSNSPRSEALITLLVFTFEMQICGWPWSAKNSNVVLYPVALGERSVSVDFGEFVRIEVFPCGFASAHEKKMVAEQRCRIRRSENTIYEHGKRCSPVANGMAECNSGLRAICETVSETGESKKEPENRPRSDEGEKVAIVSSTNTIVEPNTVMIECFDTIIANPAMIASRWPPDVTSLAIFDRDIHCGRFGSSKSNHDPVIGRRSKCEWIILCIRRWEWMNIAGNNPRVYHRRMNEGR